LSRSAAGRMIAAAVALLAMVAILAVAWIAMHTGQPAAEVPRAVPSQPAGVMTVLPPGATHSPAPTLAAEASPTVAVCQESGGLLVSDSYPGVVRGGNIPFDAYLPPCYGQSAAAYPLLILLHGKPFTEKQWLDLGLTTVADQGWAGGNLPPMILIMPRLPEPLFSNTDGGPGSYEDELVNGLLPAVEGRYRLEPGANGRALLGLSRGGVWSLEIGLRHPELFSKVGALSPALAVNHARPAFDPVRLAADPAVALPNSVYLGAGESDWARAATENLAASLAARGIEPKLEIAPGTGHEAPTWEWLLPRALGWLSAGWMGGK
jgi:enterochelin esterase-like enzyme